MTKHEGIGGNEFGRFDQVMCGLLSVTYKELQKELKKHDKSIHGENMKLPFVSRARFNDMLHEKNSQISDRDRQIADLKAEQHLLWRTEDRCHDIIRDLHSQLGESNRRIFERESELCYILNFLPESVFRKLCQSLDEKKPSPHKSNRVAPSPLAVESTIAGCKNSILPKPLRNKETRSSKN